MGVTGLWQILDSVGHPVKLDGLEGKRLGVDANIWLYKFIRGFKEKNTASSIEGHKLGLFHRISKLLFYKIKPVFVFDGPAPNLKRKTIEKRQSVRNKMPTVQEIGIKLLAEQLKLQNPGIDIDDVKMELTRLSTKKVPVENGIQDTMFIGDSILTDKAGPSHRHITSMPVETVSTETCPELWPRSASQQPTINRKIIEEAKELLRLFGIPYIDATGEAEAQCALLEELKLTDGTITDDSDVWLFGAKTVFRHFFSDDKYVMQYKMSDIEFHISMTRANLVCFAMLVGSDYTDGIQNVGPVAALEVLSEFPGEDMDPLIKFKLWRDNYSQDADRKLYSKKRAKFLKWDLPEEFPSRSVFDGYMRPMADSSTEVFKWGTPELDELREYARRNFGWDQRKIDEKLLPVMKKLSECSTQSRIDSFFFKTAANRDPELFRSKRVNEALNKISKTKDEIILIDDEDDEDEIPKQQVVEKTKKKSKETRGISKRPTRARRK